MDTQKAYSAFADQGVTMSTGNVVQSRSVLHTSLDEQGNQLEKLGSLLNQLEDRLQSVRNSVPQEGQKEGAEPTPPVSMIVNQVNINIHTIQSFQRRINSLLGELEV